MEVDQTSMELHERMHTSDGNSKGLLAPVFRIISKINGILRKSSDSVTAQSAKMCTFLTDTFQVSVNFKDKAGRTKSVKISFGEWYLLSGWRLTSTGNFLLELLAAGNYSGSSSQDAGYGPVQGILTDPCVLNLNAPSAKGT